MTALNGQQFQGHHQLTMFERTSDVIDKVHKIDGPCSGGTDSWCGQSPYDEWDEVREGKLMGGTMKGMDRSAADPGEHLAPLRIQHEGDFRGPSVQLWDGHHRLATFEEAGHQEVPVWHSFDDKETDPYTGGGYHRGRRPVLPRPPQRPPFRPVLRSDGLPD